MTVYNIKDDTRPSNCVRIDRTTIWGNPFPKSHETVENRSTAILYHRYHMECNPLLSKLMLLTEENLECWCKPKDCHGDFLATLSEGYNVMTIVPSPPVDWVDDAFLRHAIFKLFSISEEPYLSSENEFHYVHNMIDVLYVQCAEEMETVIDYIFSATALGLNKKGTTFKTQEELFNAYIKTLKAIGLWLHSVLEQVPNDIIVQAKPLGIFFPDERTTVIIYEKAESI